jgi:ketosteroid isomerase-like protein
MPNIPELIRASYDAFNNADRETMERLLAEDLSFSAPPDPHLDRAGYFERCWPHAGEPREHFEIERIFVQGDEAFVRYAMRRPGGETFRNTEYFRFEGDRIAEIQVYFGASA